MGNGTRCFASSWVGFDKLGLIQEPATRHDIFLINKFKIKYFFSFLELLPFPNSFLFFLIPSFPFLFSKPNSSKLQTPKDFDNSIYSSHEFSVFISKGFKHSIHHFCPKSIMLYLRLLKIGDHY